MKRNCILFVIISLFFCILYTSCDNQTKMQRFVKSFNKGCPTVSGNTRVDSASIVSAEEICLHITYLGNLEEFGNMDINKFFKDATKPAYSALIGQNKDWKSIRELNTIVTIVIKNADSEIISSYAVTPHDYNQLEDNNLDGAKSIDQNLEAMIDLGVKALKKQLPQSEEDGVTIIDYARDGKALVTIAVLNKINTEETTPEQFVIEGKPLLLAYIEENISIINSLNRGVIYKYVYLTEDKKPFAEIVITKDDIK